MFSAENTFKPLVLLLCNMKLFKAQMHPRATYESLVRDTILNPKDKIALPNRKATQLRSTQQLSQWDDSEFLDLQDLSENITKNRLHQAQFEQTMGHNPGGTRAVQEAMQPPPPPPDDNQGPPSQPMSTTAGWEGGLCSGGSSSTTEAGSHCSIKAGKIWMKISKATSKLNTVLIWISSTTSTECKGKNHNSSLTS